MAFIFGTPIIFNYNFYIYLNLTSQALHLQKNYCVQLRKNIKGPGLNLGNNLLLN